MQSEVKALLLPLIQQGTGVVNGLYGPGKAEIRVKIMRLVSGNPKYPKSKCGDNVVFDTLCKLVGTSPELSRAGQEAQLTNWISG